MHTFSNSSTKPFLRNAFASKASLALGVFALLSTTLMVQTASAQIDHIGNPKQILPGGSKSDYSSSGYKRVKRPPTPNTSSHDNSSHGNSSRGTSSRGTTSSSHSDRSTHRREHRREDRSHSRSDRSRRREYGHNNYRYSRRNDGQNSYGHSRRQDRSSRHYNNRYDRRHNKRHNRNNYGHSNNSYFDFSFNNRYNRRHSRRHRGYHTNYRSRLGINFFFGDSGYSSYRWATSPYSFYRPGQSSYNNYRSNTRCERVTIEANHHGHAELISVKECYNPYDGYYIIQGSERVIDCRGNGYRRPTYY